MNRPLAWIICIVGIGLAWMFSTIFHESGHAFFGYLVGMQPFDFSPYPHLRDGHLYMGYVDFKNLNVTNQLQSLMHIGSEIFQVMGFAVCLIVWRPLRKSGTLPALVGQSGVHIIGLDSFLRAYALFSFLDWPLYAINHSLKLSHFVFFGGPWWDGDVYLFAKNAGLYNYYWVINAAAAIWLFAAGSLLICVQYPGVWKRLRHLLTGNSKSNR
jgi:hypothetical protein